MHDYNQETLTAMALTGDGPIRKLEQTFEQLLKERFRCVGVSNATCGLAATLCCSAPGTVITPLFTSPATYAAIEHAGHRVRFCDIDPVSLCLSPGAVRDIVAVERRAAENDIRAIVTVNIFGHGSDLVNLQQLAREVGALLIVDAAQSLATCLRNPYHLQPADVVVFSIGPSKWLHCPDGGMVAMQSEKLWQQVVRTSQHELRQLLDVPASIPNYTHFNFRLNPYSAQQALSRLRRIETRIEMTHARQQSLIRKVRQVLAIEELPDCAEIIFEPLTILPRETAPQTLPLSGLRIPKRIELAKHHDLPETLRQFRYRKVVPDADVDAQHNQIDLFNQRTPA